MPSLSLPYKATIRTYQKDLWESLYHKTRGFFFIHRRAGKDFVCVNILTREATKRVGVYYYLFPTYEQARKVIWEGITNDGRKFIDMFPPELVAKRNEQQMSIELINGSVIRLIGTDRYDAIRGTNPVGCVFSEFAFQNPMAWDIVRPILRANGGWAIFITTPNGENHAWELYTRIKDNAKWIAQLLTIEDTKALTEEDIQEERDSGMSEAMIRQEYYCDPFALQDGVVYRRELANVELERVAYDPLLPVQTFWDLGRRDTAVCWFVQVRGDRINLIDYYENVGDWVGDWIKLLGEKPYRYTALGLPHDAFAKRNEAKDSIAGQFEEAGYAVRNIPNTSKANGISAVRRIFPRLVFDEKCKQGVTALKSYKYLYDPVKKVFKTEPDHNWASHTADALRYLAIGIEELSKENDYDKMVAEYLKPKNKTPELGIKIDEFKDYEKSLKQYLR
jgi:phage terminase large subunit